MRGRFFRGITGAGMQLRHRWTFDAQSSISAAPLIINQQNIHSITPTHQGRLIALDRQGQQVWQFDASTQLSITESFFVDANRINSILDTPILVDVDGDGAQELLFATLSGTVHCIDLSGKEKWRYKTGGPCYASPLVIQENNMPVVIVGSHDANLYKFDGRGGLLLKKAVGIRIDNSPTRVEDLILIGGSEGEVMAVDLRFDRKWVVRTAARITAPIIGAQLTHTRQITVLVGSQDGKLYALSTRGELLWVFHTRGAIVSAAIVDDVTDDDTMDILVGSCDNTVYCIDAFGELLWSYETDFWVVASPLVTRLSGSDKQVVAASYDQKLYILEGEGTYALSFIPGLSGIVNQTGQHANILSKEAGENKGKKLYDCTTMGTIVGCIRDEQQFIITTKEGRIASYEVV